MELKLKFLNYCCGSSGSDRNNSELEQQRTKSVVSKKVAPSRPAPQSAPAMVASGSTSAPQNLHDFIYVCIYMCFSNNCNLSREFSLTKTNGFLSKPSFTEKLTNIASINWHREAVGPLTEYTIATRIQTAFRGFKARKFYYNSKRQMSNTLRNLQSWNRIQAHIRTSRLAMVEDSGIKQKKIEHQLRQNAKGHNLEVEWKGSHHMMTEALARKKQREEAIIKCERTMAYAFSHQWSAHSNSNLDANGSNLATYNWG
ncbi:protein IQ-DOMAIN 1-like [Helianthus annuus]|uniref:protein IQ-DOMAIN 1-like n=1 Tax=Helianthus annuus TaxID=4232 RepID=UPI001653116C|nr:protein IQ-DOMAIN 1-like [Helianthus annuus]